jgi:glyoxylase-like metal-dependent hydrolase (beta-lactamase superfamily II)
MTIVGILGLTSAGCATTSGNVKGPANAMVKQYTQGGLAGHANCYWFETPAGAVVVDVPLLPSDAKSMRKDMDHPYRIYITAAKAERFGSLDEMMKPDVPAYTTPAVATEIQNHGTQRLLMLHAKDSDVPRYVKAPTPAIDERTHDMVGEVELELLPLGPAESENSLAIFIPKTGELIPGDVVAGGEHVDLTWGRSVVWQDRIAELKALEPKWVYPGHGAPGGPELLDQTLEYLKFFHDTVAEKVKAGAPAVITPADFKDVRMKMMARFPKLGRADLLDKSIKAEYAVQLAALPPAAAPEGGAPGATPPAGGTAPAGGAATPPSTTTSTPPASSSSTSSSSSSSGMDDLLGTPTGSDSKGKKKKKK